MEEMMNEWKKSPKKWDFYNEMPNKQRAKESLQKNVTAIKCMKGGIMFQVRCNYTLLCLIFFLHFLMLLLLCGCAAFRF